MALRAKNTPEVESTSEENNKPCSTFWRIKNIWFQPWKFGTPLFLFVWIFVDTANFHWAGRFLNDPSKKGGILKMMQQKIRDEHHQDAELNFYGTPGEIIATCSRRLVTLNDGLVTECPPKSPEFRFRNYPCLPSGIPSPSFTQNLKKMMVFKRNVFQGRIFRFHVKLWEDRFCGGSGRWRFRNLRKTFPCIVLAYQGDSCGSGLTCSFFSTLLGEVIQFWLISVKWVEMTT